MNYIHIVQIGLRKQRVNNEKLSHKQRVNNQTKKREPVTTSKVTKSKQKLIENRGGFISLEIKVQM